MCYQSFCWIKKHTVLTVLLVLWVGLLLVPPTVLTAVRVDFADSGYERAEQLKVLTRGQGITEASMRAFIEGLDLPADAKQRLLAMTPGRYTGLAEQLARAV